MPTSKASGSVQGAGNWSLVTVTDPGLYVLAVTGDGMYEGSTAPVDVWVTIAGAEPVVAWSGAVNTNGGSTVVFSPPIPSVHELTATLAYDAPYDPTFHWELIEL